MTDALAGVVVPPASEGIGRSRRPNVPAAAARAPATRIVVVVGAMHRRGWSEWPWK